MVENNSISFSQLHALAIYMLLHFIVLLVLNLETISALFYDAVLCAYKCDDINWAFHCASLKQGKWCFQSSVGCFLYGTKQFHRMNKCDQYLSGQLDQTLGCKYHCDRTNNNIDICLHTSQVCADGFNESDPYHYGSISLYDKSNQDSSIVSGNSWCNLVTDNWYTNYSQCMNLPKNGNNTKQIAFDYNIPIPAQSSESNVSTYNGIAIVTHDDRDPGGIFIPSDTYTIVTSGSVILMGIIVGLWLLKFANIS